MEPGASDADRRASPPARPAARCWTRSRSYTALRSVDIQRDRFLLNGRPYLLRLVLDQGYWPDTLLAAPDDAALRRDVELAKAMGFNGVRKHQKIEDRRATCTGPTAWACWCGRRCQSAYRFTRTAIKRLVREWTRGDRARLQPPVRHRRGCRSTNPGACPTCPSVREQRHAVRGALPPDEDARRHAPGDRQRRLGSERHRHHRHPRLRRRTPKRMRQRYGATTIAQQLFDRAASRRAHPHARRLPASRPADHADRVRRHRLRQAAARGAATWGYSVAADEADFAERYRGLHARRHARAALQRLLLHAVHRHFQEANGLLTADARARRSPLRGDRAAITRATSRTLHPRASVVMHRQRLTQARRPRRCLLYARAAVRAGARGAVARSPSRCRAAPHLRWHPLRGEWVTYAAYRQDRTFLPPPEYNPLAPTTDPAHPDRGAGRRLGRGGVRQPLSRPDRHATTARTIVPPGRQGAARWWCSRRTRSPRSASCRSTISSCCSRSGPSAPPSSARSSDVQYVLPFENRGAEVGVTLHHPHGQIYAYPVVPPVPARMLEQQRAHCEHGQRPAART